MPVRTIPAYQQVKKMDRIEINGEMYVKETPAGALEHAIIRTYSAGVFAGYVENRNGREVTLRNAIRLWKWDGAASLSQLAVEGVSKPNGCKFAMPVPRVILTEAIEIIPTTNEAREIIEGIPSWKV